METKVQRVATEERPEEIEPKPTVVGWQGMRCVLPPDWSVTGFSMDRENGYVRVDAPAPSELAVQIRWTNARGKEIRTLYHVFAPRLRKLLKRPEPPPPKMDLKANLEKILKEIAKQYKKSKSPFETSAKPEKEEGENGERRAMNFSWSGGGRGQGKIWHCRTCNRLVIAQVLGGAKDGAAISGVASRLFSNLEDHAPDGWDLWALYELQAHVPDGFRLESQSLLSGYIRLTFLRGAEKLVVERWGLANVALKKFTLADWFAERALVNTKRCVQEEREDLTHGHEGIHFKGKLGFWARARAVREGKLSLRRLPSRYEGGCWVCPETNKIYAVQAYLNARSQNLWEETAARCDCH